MSSKGTEIGLILRPNGQYSYGASSLCFTATAPLSR